MDNVEKAVKQTLSKYDTVTKKNDNFDYEDRKVRTVWDKCSAPPSVSDWEDNSYIVDAAGYVPIDKMIKRMLEDGARLEEYRSSLDYKQLYDYSNDFKDDYVDDFMYKDRAELLLSARELQSELEQIRNNKKQSTKVDTSKVISNEPISTNDIKVTETVSTAKAE